MNAEKWRLLPWQRHADWNKPFEYAVKAVCFALHHPDDSAAVNVACSAVNSVEPYLRGAAPSLPEFEGIVSGTWHGAAKEYLGGRPFMEGMISRWCNDPSYRWEPFGSHRVYRVAGRVKDEAARAAKDATEGVVDACRFSIQCDEIKRRYKIKHPNRQLQLDDRYYLNLLEAAKALELPFDLRWLLRHAKTTGLIADLPKGRHWDRYAFEWEYANEHPDYQNAKTQEMCAAYSARFPDDELTPRAFEMARRAAKKHDWIRFMRDTYPNHRWLTPDTPGHE